ncbi:TPA: 50S ribosomal protein L16 [archaeon]|uniref:Large ribosomal subunit protein uL16 n=1 Tax=Candidatus Naiadarchaeum limnaeum TaxID=2756139 RepID=A0A832V1E3_9ARCH|nr:50S ribosomal protein L16 [Candidatus Naiadarchaeales archaeon SRR2090153.bin1042]HIK00311.1 50S ribosomal protein L16 [Candidatus Naiadarchaeum limnaeum]
MAERKGGVYAKYDGRPYTRQSERVPRVNYVRGVPKPKIHTFQIGDQNAEFEYEVQLISDENVQITHRALEASRVAATKTLGTAAGASFFMKVYPYPHHVLRENPMATGAGADRFQEGMSRAFGKPIGTAARIRVGQKVIGIRVNQERIELAKEALRRAKMKLPCNTRTIVQKLKKI